METRYQQNTIKDNKSLDNNISTHSLKFSSTNHYNLKNNNPHQIQKQKERITNYDDKVNQIVKKYENIIEKGNPKLNHQNQPSYKPTHLKTQQKISIIKHSQPIETSLIQRTLHAKPKSQLQNNREIVLAMRNELHSKLNDLSKQTANKSFIYNESTTLKPEQNNNKKQFQDKIQYSNMQLSSYINPKEYLKNKQYAQRYDKIDKKIDQSDVKAQYVTFKNNQMKISLSLNKNAFNATNNMNNTKDNVNNINKDQANASSNIISNERNNKMIQQQINRLDKRIKQIQQNKRRSSSIMIYKNKNHSSRIENDIVNIKICESNQSKQRNRIFDDIIVQKNTSPLNQNWNEYNNRYKQYVSKIKPFQVVSTSTIINKDKENHQLSKSIDEHNNKQTKYNHHKQVKQYKQRYSPVIKIDDNDGNRLNQQYNLYKRRAKHYEQSKKLLNMNSSFIKM